MKPHELAERLDSLPAIPLGDELFIITESGAVNVRHVVQIEEHRGRLRARFRPTDHVSAIVENIDPPPPPAADVAGEDEEPADPAGVA